MKRILVGAAAALWLASAGCIVVSKEESHYDGKTRPAPIVRTAICPVDHVTIDDVSTAPSYTYQGKTRYFCCPDCRAKFEGNPGSYVRD
jgi:YHS domain-containing protein